MVSPRRCSLADPLPWPRLSQQPSLSAGRRLASGVATAVTTAVATAVTTALPTEVVTVFATALSLVVAMAATPAAGLAGSLVGTATLKVPMPVPDQALFEAQLQESGAADAPAVLLGKARLKPAGMAPFRFRIPYVDGMVRPGRRYSVRALISEAGRLLFTTDTLQTVMPGSGSPLQLQLVPVGDAPLRGVTWLQAPAASQPVSPQAARQEVQLRLDPLTPMVTGSADCNRLQGTYRLEGDRLSFSGMDSTMLQCEPEVMADERRFLADLQRVRGWRFVDRYFELLDASGAVLLKLETRPQSSPPAAASGG